MRTYFIVSLILLSIMTMGQEKIDESMILSLVTENNLSYRSSLLNKKTAYQNYQKVLLEFYPEIEFTTDPNTLGYPLYSYQNSRNILSGDPTVTHKIGAGLSVNQKLPGAGNLNLNLKNRLEIKSETEENPYEYSQTPNINLIYNQPVLYNNAFIDFGINKAQTQLSQIGYQKAEKNSRELKNRIIITAYSLAGQAQGLRRNNFYLEESIRIHLKDLDDLLIKKEQGRASDTDVLSLKLNIGKKKEQLLESQYILQEAEQNLILFLGLETGTFDFELNYPEINFPDEPSLSENNSSQILTDTEKLILSNPQITLQELRLEELALSHKISGLEQASFLNFFASLSPLYPFSRDNEEELSYSFSGLWESDSFLDYSVGLSLTIPLFDGGRNKIQSQIFQNNQKAALISLYETKNNLGNKLKSLIFRRQILREQINQLSLNIEYENLMLEKESDLFVLGGSTENELVRVELDIISLENNLLRAKSELFINTLEIGSLLGYDLEEFLKNNLTTNLKR